MERRNYDNEATRKEALKRLRDFWPKFDELPIDELKNVRARVRTFVESENRFGRGRRDFLVWKCAVLLTDRKISDHYKAARKNK
tara:strand:- start:79 stop:330 length:252 start_codon:yes stop_codon:yes gene_type:complete